MWSDDAGTKVLYFMWANRCNSKGDQYGSFLLPFQSSGHRTDRNKTYLAASRASMSNPSPSTCSGLKMRPRTNDRLPTC